MTQPYNVKILKYMHRRKPTPEELKDRVKKSLEGKTK